MNKHVVDRLAASGRLTGPQHGTLSDIYQKRVFSLFYELRTMLYLGVLLFTSGIGILIYKNIDTIGHQVIIFLLVLLMSGCFWYAFRKMLPYSHSEVQSPGVLYDYAFLLSCLLFAIIIGYLQFQYSIFSEQWALSALIPALVYFPLAYRFDHRGVLSLGITGLASWLGLTVSPMELIKESIFPKTALVHSGLLFGALVIACGLFLDRRAIKRHFTFTYVVFGFLTFGAASLTGLFTLESILIFFVLTLTICAFGVHYARREQSFFFLLMSALYGYIAMTYALSQFISDFAFWELYFIVSCGLMVYGLFKYKRLLGRK